MKNIRTKYKSKNYTRKKYKGKLKAQKQKNIRIKVTKAKTTDETKNTKDKFSV